MDTSPGTDENYLIRKKLIHVFVGSSYSYAADNDEDRLWVKPKIMWDVIDLIYFELRKFDDQV